MRGKRILLVDNIVRSGETINHFRDLIVGIGGEVIGIATLWNLGDAEIAGLPVFGLLNSDYDIYPSDGCPLCAAGSTPEPAPY